MIRSKSTLMCCHTAARAFALLALAGSASTGWARDARLMDIARSGRVTQTTVEWDEERDVQTIRARFAGQAVPGASVEYWFKNWPYEAPKMPTIEDPVDDPWQGEWLKASAKETCSASECTYEFEPLSISENKLAKNMPGVRYRRTLKVRLVFPGVAPGINALEIYNGTELTPLHLRVDFESNAKISVYNGILQSSKPDGKGLVLDLLAAKPSLPGSHDATVVTVAGEKQTFSFDTGDLRYGPIALPEFHALVTDLAAKKTTAATGKLKVRQRILQQPEQTYERASREIPPLDPWNRENGERVYLPLAPDSNWQKFAVEYGGNVFVSKTGIKAKGRELERLQWSGNIITWKIGTGQTPYYRDDHKVSVRRLDGYLPVVTQRWANEGLNYSEETFATVVRGPLSPEGEGRDEETPAILMLQITAENSGAAASKAHLLLNVDSAGQLSLDGNTVRGNGKVVAQLVSGGATASLDSTGVRIAFDVPAGKTRSVQFLLPCVSDLTASDVADLEKLNYNSERQRVIAYWKKIVEPTERITVPEEKFHLLARAVIPQIHISTTKDPKTGLYMVPAASYVYDVFPNESAYQILLLDALGDFETAKAYLETSLRLQGSKNFPGLHSGNSDGILHGSRIDSVYDYTAHGYGLDHGTLLWTLALHYQYSRDRAWLEHAWPHMDKAIEWIERQRAATKITGPDGQRVREYGLLPASQLEDNPDWANWFSINAYAWAGMLRTSEALADIESPEAERIRKAADDYRADLRAAILRAVVSAPAARMQDGTYEPYVPVLPTRRFRLFGPIRAAYYERYGHPEIKPLMRLGADRDTLCGAVVLLLLNVFSPDEPIANWILNDWEDNETLSSGMGMNIHGMTDDRYWFSQGGMVFQANLVNPIQVYLRRHEAQAAIRNLYNDFVSCLYPDVNIFTEEYHQWRHGSGPFYKISDEARFVNRVRDVVVFEDGDDLWLASGAPRRWLASKEGIRVKEAYTFFGPVSYTLRAGKTPGVVEADVSLPSRNAPKKAWLAARVPSGHIQSVTVNGKPWSGIDRQKEAIELPQDQGPLHVEIRYR